MTTYIYENRTDTEITVTLASADNHTAAVHVFPPAGRMELDYPGLDQYVPPLFKLQDYLEAQPAYAVVNVPTPPAPPEPEPIEVPEIVAEVVEIPAVEIPVEVESIPEPVVEETVEEVVVEEVVAEESAAPVVNLKAAKSVKKSK